MNVLQHTRNELNLFPKQNRPDRSYRDTLLSSLLFEGPPTTSILRVVQRLEILSLTERRSILSSGTYLSARKTPIGPVAGHYQNPILPFGLGLKAFCFPSDNVF